MFEIYRSFSLRTASYGTAAVVISENQRATTILSTKAACLLEIKDPLFQKYFRIRVVALSFTVIM